MPDTFDDFDNADEFAGRLAAAATRLEQEAAVRSPAGVRARGDQRRRRHTATMAVVPVAVLAIAGTVGLTLQPSGGHSRQGVSGVPTTAGHTTPSAPVPTSPSRTATPAPTATVDLTQHTMKVFDAQGKLVKALPMTAGKPGYPTRTGTFTVVDKKLSQKLDYAVDGSTYDGTVSFFIDLGPNAPHIFGAPWQDPYLGKVNATHGDIELALSDAAWLLNRLTVGDTIQIVGAPAP